MSPIKQLFSHLTVVAVLLAATGTAFAQTEFDDIYYNPSKAKKEKKTSQKKTTPTTQGTYKVYTTGNSVVGEYLPADRYEPGKGRTDVDVDTYNRRGIFATDNPSGNGAGTQDEGEFAYTRRIEKYHNPDVVEGSDDPDLIDAYNYAQQQAASNPNINVYVINNPSGLYNWSYARYNGLWGPGYSPWYWSASAGWDYYWDWNWGWTCNWGWPYYPYSWNYGWGYGPAWGWNLGWGPGWYPAWRYPAHAHWAPTPSGSSRPHRPVYSGSSNYRPGQSGRRPVNNSDLRPGNVNRRPGSSGLRPGSSGLRPGSNINSSANSIRPGNSGRVSSQAVNPNSTVNSSSTVNAGFNSPTRHQGIAQPSINKNTGNSYNSGTVRQYNSNNNNYNNNATVQQPKVDNSNRSTQTTRQSYSTPSSRPGNSGSSYSGGGRSGGGGGSRGRH